MCEGPKPLISGDKVIWKGKGLQGEIICFDLAAGKFEVYFLSTGRHEYIIPDNLCRTGGDEESGVELKHDDKHYHDENKSNDNLQEGHQHHHGHHSRSHTGSEPIKSLQSNEKKGHFKQNGHWDPGNGTHRHHTDSHIHSILDSENAQTELAEALGISATKTKRDSEIKLNVHALGVEQRRIMMGVGAGLAERRLSESNPRQEEDRKRSTSDPTSRLFDRNLFDLSLSQRLSASRNNRSGSRGKSSSRSGSASRRDSASRGKSSCSRPSSISSRENSSGSLKRVGSHKTGLKYGAESKRPGGMMGRSKSQGSSLRDLGQRSGSKDKPPGSLGQAEMKKVGSDERGLRLSAKSQRPGGSVSMGRSNSQRPGSRERNSDHLSRSSSKPELLARIMSGEQYDLRDLRGKGSRI